MSQNVVIQEISEEKISLKINGEVKEIQSQLQELKTLIQSQENSKLQYADQIINIENLNEANFGFLQRSKQAQVFNEKLSKKVIEAIQPCKKGVQKFLKQAARYENWEKKDAISNKAKEIIAYSFVGPLGVQLSKLMAIGKEDFSEKKQEKYIQKCLEISKISLDILSFILLSKLWDIQHKSPISLHEKEANDIRNFFEGTFETTVSRRYEFLQVLIALFQRENIDMPLEEMKIFAQKQFQTEAPFAQICQKLQALNDKLDQKDYNLLDCAEAENQLSEMLTILHFLACYKMVSMKNIGYNEIRTLEPRYLHQYAALGIDSKANIDAEKVNFMPEPVNTEAILLYKGEYKNALNLFPFIIDYNTLTFEDGAKICFYSHQDLEDESLNYRFLEDNSLQNIVLQKIAGENYSIEDFMESPDKRKELSELIKEPDNRKRFNLNYVYLLFQEAQKKILNQSPNKTNLEAAFDMDFEEED